MKTQITKFARWICGKVTSEEFDSLLSLFQEISSGARPGFNFKPDPSTANYRKFKVDTTNPLLNQPKTNNLPTNNWKDLKAAYEQENGKKIKPVKRRDGFDLPDYCRCEKCNAPAKYLYLNDGKKKNQVRCKICNHLSPTHRVRRESNAKYFCPYCHKPLSLWKKKPTEDIYKCMNNACPHFLANEAKLTSEERKKRKKQKFDPNYKLHYQYREYHLLPKDFICRRPNSISKVDLTKIHNSYSIVGLVLTFFINAGLSSRITRDLLFGLYGIQISHQTVINYVNAAATKIAPFLDKDLPKPTGIAAADETYLIVEDEWHYTWFIIDSETKAICGYNLSDTRGVKPALATIYDAYDKPQTNLGKQHILVRDGCPSYDAAMMAYNQGLTKPVLVDKKVIGLSNVDDTSEEYRPYKQLVERLNRTYKFHTRPRGSMKSLNGAISLTTLFVAYYNYLRVHSLLQRVPFPRSQLNNITNYPKQWEVLLTM